MKDFRAVGIRLAASQSRQVGIELGFDETGWRCVFSSDWAGYHESGSDTETLSAPGIASISPYSAALTVPV